MAKKEPDIAFIHCRLPAGLWTPAEQTEAFKAFSQSLAVSRKVTDEMGWLSPEPEAQSMKDDMEKEGAFLEHKPIIISYGHDGEEIEIPKDDVKATIEQLAQGHHISFFRLDEEDNEEEWMVIDPACILSVKPEICTAFTDFGLEIPLFCSMDDFLEEAERKDLTFKSRDADRDSVMIAQGRNDKSWIAFLEVIHPSQGDESLRQYFLDSASELHETSGRVIHRSGGFDSPKRDLLERVEARVRTNDRYLVLTGGGFHEGEKTVLYIDPDLIHLIEYDPEQNPKGKRNVVSIHLSICTDPLLLDIKEDELAVALKLKNLKPEVFGLTGLVPQ